MDGEPRRVVVKFHDDSTVPATLPVPHGVSVRRLFCAGLDELRDLSDRAKRNDPTYQAHKLENFIAVDIPGSTPFGLVYAAVDSWPGDKSYYLQEPWTEDIPGSTTRPSPDPKQRYLDPAPLGVDAGFAWDQVVKGEHVRGQGVEFVDLETGWMLNHEDLPDPPLKIIHGGENWGQFRWHGTQVLGIVLAKDNGHGVVGLAPDVSARLVSERRSDGTFSTCEAVFDAARYMKPGGVLLLETQTNLRRASELPAEVDYATWIAIRLATALGIIVVEAAGNGGITHGQDLDRIKTELWGQSLNRNCRDFRDSKAIIVGAAESAKSHLRLESNYGSRLDCFAWGQEIYTTDFYVPKSDHRYTYLNKTSGASAIVAGVAILVQSYTKAKTDEWLTPDEMRALLSAKGNTCSPDPIGRMPDLRWIFEHGLRKLWEKRRRSAWPVPNASLQSLPPERDEVRVVPERGVEILQRAPPQP